MGSARQATERLFEMSNRHDAEGVLRLYAPRAEVTTPLGPRMSPGTVLQTVKTVWSTHPDWRYAIHHIVEEGKTAAFEGMEGGTSSQGSRLFRLAGFVVCDDTDAIERLTAYWYAIPSAQAT